MVIRNVLIIVATLALLVGGAFLFIGWKSDERAEKVDSAENEEQTAEEVVEEEEPIDERVIQWKEPLHVAEQQLTESSEIVVDVDQEQIIYANNIDTPLGLASMSKTMIQYLVMKAVDEGKLSWESTYVTPPHFFDHHHAEGIAMIGLQKNKKYTLDYLFRAVAVHSGNDAAMALVYLLADTYDIAPDGDVHAIEAAFVQWMNDTAAELGMTNTHFINPHGLTVNGEYNKGSARDLATLISYTIKQHPDILNYTELATVTSEYGEVVPTTNWLLKGMPFETEGVRGYKTGFTYEAGPCVSSAVERNGHRYVTVLQNWNDGSGDFDTYKFKHTTELVETYIDPTLTTEEE